MDMPRRGDRRAQAALPALYFLAVTVLLARLFSDWAYDDPFITFRYAENLANGRGFVYNPGEATLSTTTPLFSLFLAALKPAAADLHPLAVLIGAASLAAGALFLWDISRTWGTRVVGWTALVLYPTSAFVVSTLSSETPLYLALCLGTIALYARGAYLPAAFLSAMAALARPDGLVLAGVLAIHYLAIQRGSIPWKVAIAFGVPLLAWWAFAWLYFGSPIPVTLAAKQGQGLLPVSRSFLRGLTDLIEGYAVRLWPLVPAILAAAGLARLVRKPEWALPLAWTGAYFASFILLGVSSYFWYYAPLLPGLLVLVGLGLDGLAEWLAARTRLSRGAVRLPVLFLIGFTAVFQLADLSALLAQPDPRRPAYQATGEWLRRNTAPDALVGTLEVGIIGYYARNPMLDFSGLIQPEVAGRFSSASSYEDTAIWAVETYQPEYLVLHNGLMPRLESGYVQGSCTPVFTLYGGAYGYDRDLAVYDCR